MPYKSEIDAVRYYPFPEISELILLHRILNKTELERKTKKEGKENESMRS
jgi:hypothetical protein